MNSQKVFTRMLIILGIASLLVLAGCGGGTGQSFNNPPPGQPPSQPSPNSPNPVPMIVGLTQNCAQVGGQAFSLSVLGSNFVSSSVVRWNGSDRPTTFDNSGQLSAQVSASDIASPGTAAVTVFNPAPGGGSSNTFMLAIATGGVSPQSVVVDPAGKFAYVASWGCAFAGNVSMYTINPTTGGLTSIGPRLATASNTQSVTVDPFGKFAYVPNEYSKNVSTYTIDTTTGTLMPAGTISTGGRAVSVTVHPSGKFAYVADGCGSNNHDSVSMYAVDPNTGALTSVGTIPTAATGPSACSINVWIAIDPSGRFAYVTSDGCGYDTYHSYVSIYTINPTTGALTPVGQTVVSAACSGSLSVHPSGNFAYVADNQNNNVSMYAIDAKTGALTLLGTIAAGSGPMSSAVHPSAKFAYVANSGSNDVSMYTINPTTGALSLIGTIPAGSSPKWIAIHPLGKFAYVTNSGSNDVSMYSIDAATGALTLIGTIGT